MIKLNHFEIWEILLSHPEADPLGFEGILILEEFNRVFTELLTCYGRLIYYSKFHKSSIHIDVIDIDHWVNRRAILIYLKNIFYYKEMLTIREVTKKYRSELAIVRDYEDSFKF